MVENHRVQFAAGIEPGPQQEVWRQQRNLMAGGAIDFDEFATPEIFDTCQVEGLHSGIRCLRELAGGRQRALEVSVEGGRNRPTRYTAKIQCRKFDLGAPSRDERL
jgi:hypothetical protein